MHSQDGQRDAFYRPVRKGGGGQGGHCPPPPHAESAANFCEIRGNFGEFHGLFLMKSPKFSRSLRSRKRTKLYFFPQKKSPKGGPLVIFGYIDIVKNNKWGPLVLPLHSVSWPLPRKMSAYGPVLGG